MSDILTTRIFDTEFERNALESHLRQRGFHKVSPLTHLRHNEYCMIDGTSNSNTFEGQKKFGIKWLEDK